MLCGTIRCAVLVRNIFRTRTQRSGERRKWEEPQNLAALNTTADDFAPAYSFLEKLLYFTSAQSGYAEIYTSRYDARRDATHGRIVHALPLRSASPPHSTNLATIRHISLCQRRKCAAFNISHDATSSLSQHFPSCSKQRHFVKPDPVDALNTDGFNAHPALIAFGKKCCFRIEPFGWAWGIDLWTANRDESGTWQPPVNMSDVLNSSEDEITPCFASEDSLYFASNGFGGKGGLKFF